VTHIAQSSVGSLTNCGRQKHVLYNINGDRLLASLVLGVLAHRQTAGYEWRYGDFFTRPSVRIAP
jgi:hypothetical protein